MEVLDPGCVERGSGTEQGYACGQQYRPVQTVKALLVETALHGGGALQVTSVGKGAGRRRRLGAPWTARSSGRTLTSDQRKVALKPQRLTIMPVGFREVHGSYTSVFPNISE